MKPALRLIYVYLLLVAGMTSREAQALSVIRRRDGTTIPVSEAEQFPRTTLEREKVPGAQIAVVQGGRIAWSAAFGLRGRDPALPMDRDTTTWAASITKSVF